MVMVRDYSPRRTAVKVCGGFVMIGWRAGLSGRRGGSRTAGNRAIETFQVTLSIKCGSERECGQGPTRTPVRSQVAAPGSAIPTSKSRPPLKIEAALASFDPIPLGGWQAKIADSIGHRPTTLAECFLDVDGELLIGRLISLAELAVRRQRSIEFM
jgi:hypothetical protein